jgi:hypothetical protein
VIAIDHLLISDEVVEAQFVCNLSKCKGGCCEEGDAGAPLTKEELSIVKESYEIVTPYLTPEGIAEVQRKGHYEYDKEFGYVTPTINGHLCAYGKKDATGTILCAFEQAYNDGKIAWKKPISCHLYPIKIKSTDEGDLVNYEPRDVLCSPGCELGATLKVPVYKFLKEALIRKYGEDMYEVIDQVAQQYFTDKKQ